MSCAGGRGPGAVSARARRAGRHAGARAPHAARRARLAALAARRALLRDPRARARLHRELLQLAMP